MDYNEHILRKKFGEVFTSSGDEYKVKCPECGKKSLWININKNVYLCFFCDFRGKADKLLSLEVKKKSLLNTKKIIKDNSSLPEGYVQVKSKSDFPEGWNYMISRKLNPNTIEFGTDDRLSVIFPVRENGKLVIWQRRSIYKYVKTKAINELGIDKTDYVYNIDMVKENDLIFIAEGIPDSYHCGGVSILGKVISDNQLDKILIKRPILVVIALDSDAIKDSIMYSDMFSKKGVNSIPFTNYPYSERIKYDPANIGLEGMFNLFSKQIRNSTEFRTRLLQQSLSETYISKLLQEKLLQYCRYVLT